MTHKTKIAILGGGIAALTAAFELTEQDPNEERYDITVYTLGWRLGGKCLVGRDHRDGRAREHGLHVWAGFYDNAFDLVQRLYARLGYSPNEWRSKFEGVNHFTVMEFVDNSWKPWLLQARPNNLDPGIDLDNALVPLTVLSTLLSWVEQSFVDSALARAQPPSARTAVRQEIAAALKAPIDDVFPTALSAIQALLNRVAGDTITANDREAAHALVEAFRKQVGRAVHSAPNDDETRRMEIVFDLAAGLIKGILSDEVLTGGFDAIDDWDWSEWMEHNGCKAKSTNSAIVRGCYDYVFGYIKGSRQVGAGVGTIALLRLLLTYKGSIFYALQEPMGDFLFARLYTHLCKHKVKFKFFHRLDDLKLSNDGSAIEEIVFGRQVKLRNLNVDYDPLIDVPGKKYKSWPIHPDYDQIEHGKELKDQDLESTATNWRYADSPLSLKRRAPGDRSPTSNTFDIAILAVGFGGLPSICKDLCRRHPDTWGMCLTEVQTTSTLALQLWLRKEAEKLGWPDPGTVMVGFAHDEDTWSEAPLHSWQDNTRLLSRESSNSDETPRSLAYFVGVFPEAEDGMPHSNPQFRKSEMKRAKLAVEAWMNKRLTKLWPGAAENPNAANFNWDLLDAPPGTTGSKRLDYQYLRTNIEPWERYVLSRPGSMRSRLWPDGSGLSNLFLAGDWVRTGLDAGCIEAAIMSGRAAARTITGGDMFIPGYGNSGNIPVPISLLPVANLLKQLRTGVAAGVGSMEGYCITIMRDPKAVEKLLPPGLSLDTPEDLKTKSEHPIVFLFCKQKNVRPGFVPFGGMRYHEIIQLIPFVRQSDGGAPAGGPFSYMPHLYLDEIAPVLIGVNLYGFNKRLARIASDGGSFELQTDIGEIRTNLSEEKLPGRATRFPKLRLMRQLLERPFIAQTTNGVFVYSYLDFFFDTATFQGVKGEVDLGVFDPDPPKAPAPPPKAPAQPSPPLEIFSIADKDFGAFRLQTNWNLSVPLSEGAQKGSVVPPDLKAFANSLQGLLRR